jgi:hypothetical protein
MEECSNTNRLYWLQFRQRLRWYWRAQCEMGARPTTSSVAILGNLAICRDVPIWVGLRTRCINIKEWRTTSCDVL